MEIILISCVQESILRGGGARPDHALQPLPGQLLLHPLHGHAHPPARQVPRDHAPALLLLAEVLQSVPVAAVLGGGQFGNQHSVTVM